MSIDEKFRQKDGNGKPPEDGGRNPTVDFKGERRSNETHQSTTDPDARLYKKSEGDKSRMSYLSHALMENCNAIDRPDDMAGQRLETGEKRCSSGA